MTWLHWDPQHMNKCMTKPTKWHVRPAKTQIRLGIRSVWLESSLSAWRKLGSLAIHWLHSKESDQTALIPRLIWVFARRTSHFQGQQPMPPIFWYVHSHNCNICSNLCQNHEECMMQQQITEGRKHVFFSTAFYQKCILHIYSSYFRNFDQLCLNY